MVAVLEERIIHHDTYTNTEKVIQFSSEIIANNDLTENQIQKLERTQETFVFLKEVLDIAQPWLISINTLNALNSNIVQILSYLNNFNSNKNDQYLDNVSPYLEAMLPYFTQFTIVKTPEEIEGVKTAVVKFKQSIGQHLSYLEREINNTSTAFNKNTEKLSELTTSVENQKARIDSIISDFQNQFLNGQNLRTDQFNNMLKTAEADFKGMYDSNDDRIKQTFENQQQLFEAVLNEQKKKFEELKSNLEQEYNELLENQHQTFDSLNFDFQQQVDNQNQSFGVLMNEFKNNFYSEFDKIKDMNKQAEKILGLMSMKGLAQGYQKIANDEGKKANIWNIGSVLSIIVVIIFGAIFILAHEGTFTWTTLVSRIVITGIGLTLFTYCAKEASNHRIEERHNRKMELELASLEPYLKDFEPEMQKEIKQSLVDKYFGVELPILTGKQKGKITQQSIIESIMNNPQFVETIIEKVTKSISKSE